MLRPQQTCSGLTRGEQMLLALAETAPFHRAVADEVSARMDALYPSTDVFPGRDGRRRERGGQKRAAG
jgi:hypothetical protein